MALCSTIRLFPLAGLIALLALLALTEESSAQKKKKATPLEKAAKQEVNLREAHVLREAYILMAMANHNYEGHRVAAMKKVHNAIEILDGRILKKGTDGQKTVATMEDVSAARVKFIAKHSAKVHEPRVLSNLQLNEARKLLMNLREPLAAYKQPKLLGMVDGAIHEITVALSLR